MHQLPSRTHVRDFLNNTLSFRRSGATEKSPHYHPVISREVPIVIGTTRNLPSTTFVISKELATEKSPKLIIFSQEISHIPFGQFEMTKISGWLIIFQYPLSIRTGGLFKWKKTRFPVRVNPSQTVLFATYGGSCS